MNKKRIKIKSRTAKSAKNHGFNFHWWMALVLVIIVAGVGLVILRYSQAATGGESGTAQILIEHTPSDGAVPALLTPEGQMNIGEDVYFRLYEDGQLYCNYKAKEGNKNGKTQSDTQVAMIGSEQIASLQSQLYAAGFPRSENNVTIADNNESITVNQPGVYVADDIQPDQITGGVIAQSAKVLQETCRNIQKIKYSPASLLVNIAHSFVLGQPTGNNQIDQIVLNNLPNSEQDLTTFEAKRGEINKLLKIIGQDTSIVVAINGRNYAIGVTNILPKPKQASKDEVEKQIKTRTPEQLNGTSINFLTPSAEAAAWTSANAVQPIYFIPKRESAGTSSGAITEHFHSVRNWYAAKANKTFKLNTPITVYGNKEIWEYQGCLSASTSFLCGDLANKIAPNITNELSSRGYKNKGTIYMTYFEGNWKQVGGACGATMGGSTASNTQTLYGFVPLDRPSMCGTSTNSLNRRIMAHEIGHAFSFPDYYDNSPTIMDSRHVYSCSWTSTCKLNYTQELMLRYFSPYFASFSNFK